MSEAMPNPLPQEKTNVGWAVDNLATCIRTALNRRALGRQEVAISIASLRALAAAAGVDEKRIDGGH